jgi:hypothetical protein
VIAVETFAARLLNPVEVWCLRSYKIVYNCWKGHFNAVLNLGERQLRHSAILPRKTSMDRRSGAEFRLRILLFCC